MNLDVNAACCQALVDEWVRAGLTTAAVAPGSRSTPLVLALTGEPRVRTHVCLDERSAAFFALGAAKATGRPALAVCTSGTAGAHFHAAVLEAHHSRIPLLVCTADRPAELQATGAPQTIDQTKLFGDTARFFAHLAPEAHPDQMASWRPLAARLWAETIGPPAGPVHLNLAFREPLVPQGEPAEVPGRADGRPWVTSAAARRSPAPETVDRLAGLVGDTERGVVVAGWGAGPPEEIERFARAVGWPLLADPLSGARYGPHAVSTYEALLRAPAWAGEHRPDVALRLGGPLTSKVATNWLDADVAQILVDPDAAWLDPNRTASERVAADPGLLLAAVGERLGGRDATSKWTAGWLEAEARARPALDRFLDSHDAPFEGRVARDLCAALPAGSTLMVASSMPVRDVEAFAAPRSGLRVFSNRGTNGIDGFASTTFGVASEASGPVAGLCGDLAFLHDAAGLVFAARHGIDATLVIVDNDGGGIFSFLPQAEALPDARFEMLFGTPHGLDLTAVATAFGLPATRIESAAELVPAVEAALAAGGPRVVVVRTGDRTANVARHREAWAAVAEALNP
jgi:2-succinyl-5-enolpyruvyl-6-hydroxy-3-cyclohexene-1-carboxylate synthase